MTAWYDVFRYNKTNATSLWCCQHDCIPLGCYNHAGNPTEMLYLFNVKVPVFRDYQRLTLVENVCLCFIILLYLCLYLFCAS